MWPPQVKLSHNALTSPRIDERPPPAAALLFLPPQSAPVHHRGMIWAVLRRSELVPERFLGTEYEVPSNVIAATKSCRAPGSPEIWRRPLCPIAPSPLPRPLGVGTPRRASSSLTAAPSPLAIFYLTAAAVRAWTPVFLFCLAYNTCFFYRGGGGIKYMYYVILVINYQKNRHVSYESKTRLDTNNM